MAFVVLFSAVGLLFLLILRARKIGRREPGLPPGPPTVPILGNLHQFPRENVHLRLTEWARAYGGIISLKISSGTVIVLSNPRVVQDLMEARSSTTANRPASHFGDLVTGGKSLVIMKHDSAWRRSRRIASEMLTKSACAKHLPIQHAEATQVMWDLLKEPDRFFDHINRYSNSVITSILAGVRSPRASSASVVGFYNVIHKWTALMEPGAHPPVDLFPILKHVPERWASWKSLCREIRALQRAVYFGLLDRCETRIANEKQNGSFLEDVLEHLDSYGIDREIAGYLCGTLLEGGSETTATFVLNFILFMVNYPLVQAKAQEEVDRIIGADRTPVVDDFEHLPYVQALVKELFRIRPPVQMGVPHSSTADETVHGYVVPKDSVLIVNLWAIGHDPSAFDDPESFDPERFLKSEFGTKPGADDYGRRHDLAFGFGRRLCVGMRLAEASLALNIMNLLWAFDFLPAIDPATKQPVKPSLDNYTKGVTLTPLPFTCNIHPRNSERVKLVEENFAEARSVFEQFEYEISAEDAEHVRSLPRK
ncbi:cytochrome P450 [Dentipellis sp. KUC8613]|nr:cytochrome P450 [Dentipellis sp. KUC8613]